jgi:epoxyqueuosine reductase
VLGPRLQALADYVAGCRPGTATRAYIDTGPLLERDAAARAGLGFVGRNTMLIHPGWGSWLFLGVLLTDLDLEPDPPGEGTCGRCTRCLEACPTDAFPRPHVLDARRCISYLTIELKGPIPRHLRSALGNRIFGCDICNEVCPYNRRLARSGPDPALVPRVEWVAPRLLDLVGLDEAGFRGRFRGSPVLRPKRRGFLRNVCVALGNWGAPEAVDALGAAADDAEALIRGHAVWALGRIGTASATNHLMRRRKGEADSWVLEEIDLALQARDRRSGA